MKHCKGCDTAKPVTDFNKNRSSKDGLQYRCRQCQLAANRQWCERHPEVRRAALRRQYRREKAKPGSRRPSKSGPAKAKKAQLAVWNATLTGRLIRPDNCSACGSSEWPIQAHHEDYSRPLDVQWLCTRCHGRLHAAKKQGAA
jgi:ribosomal protein L44E